MRSSFQPLILRLIFSCLALCLIFALGFFSCLSFPCFFDGVQFPYLVCKYFYKVGEVLHSFQKRSAFFFQLVESFLKPTVSVGFAVVSLTIILHTAVQFMDLAAAGDSLRCKRRQLLVIVLADSRLARQRSLSHVTDLLHREIDITRRFIADLLCLDLLLQVRQPFFVLHDLILQRCEILCGAAKLTSLKSFESITMSRS